MYGHRHMDQRLFDIARSVATTPVSWFVYYAPPPRFSPLAFITGPIRGPADRGGCDYGIFQFFTTGYRAEFIFSECEQKPWNDARRYDRCLSYIGCNLPGVKEGSEMMALTCRCSNPTASAAFAEWDVAAGNKSRVFP